MHPAPGPPPRILCYDADSFFCQAALLTWPDRLAGVELLLVGGHPERRGVVASCSYGTRRFGVHSGMPMAAALRLCPDALAVPVPGPMVRRKSRAVRAVIQRFSGAFEAASVDEGYFTVAEGEEPLEEVARRIQAAVREETRITISLGGATRRFLAKMATRHAKPAGVHVVPAGEEIAFLDRHQPGDIPGVGPAFVESLRKRGIASIPAARRMDLPTLTHWLGPARAHFLHRRVRAIDDSRIGEGRDERKSISSETTFARDLTETAPLLATLEELAADMGRALRRLGLRARTVGLKLRESDFEDHSRSRTLPAAVETDRVLYRVAAELLHELRARHRGPVRLLGMTVSGLVGPGAAEQLAFPEIIPPLETDEDRDAQRAAG